MDQQEKTTIEAIIQQAIMVEQEENSRAAFCQIVNDLRTMLSQLL